MFEKRVVTVIGAHPDDYEIGMGELLAHLLRNQCKVKVLVVTDGSKGGISCIRKDEQRASVKYLQDNFSSGLTLSERSFFYPDTELEANADLISFLEQEVRGSDTVFTHFPKDTHQDHRALGVAIQSACRFVPTVLYFQSYTSLEWNPTIFFPVFISESSSFKLDQLKCHKSQIETYSKTKFDMVAEAITLARYNGWLCKCESFHAEGFVPFRLTI